MVSYFFKRRSNSFYALDQAGNFSSPAGQLPIEIVWDANTWYHVAVVRDTDNSILNVYLNGQLISSDADAMQEVYLIMKTSL